MAARNEAKVKEGRKHIASGEKCLQTGLFKWKPDHEGAAAAFKDAANCFKVARAHEDAKSAFVKAGNALEAVGSDFHAAKHYEQAAMMAKELKQGPEAADLFETAGRLFRLNGSADTAGIMLDRAGKILEPLDGSRALKMYVDSAELSEDSDKLRQAVESLSKAVQLMVKYRKFDDCVKAMEHLLVLYEQLGNFQQMHKVCLSIVLVQLCKDDYVAADRHFHNFCGIDGFTESDAAGIAEDLLQAYDNGDLEAMERVTGDQYFSFISTEIARLARCLRGPQDLAPPDASLNQPKAKSLPSYTKTSSLSSTRPAAAKSTPARAAEDRAALFGEAPSMPPATSGSGSGTVSPSRITSSDRVQPRASGGARKPASDPVDDRAALFGSTDETPAAAPTAEKPFFPAVRPSASGDAAAAKDQPRSSPTPEPSPSASFEPAATAELSEEPKPSSTSTEPVERAAGTEGDQPPPEEEEEDDEDFR